MQNNVTPKDMASIISESEITSPVSSNVDERVFAFISGYSKKEKPGINPFTFFRYNPSRGLFLIIPLVLILTLILFTGRFTQTTEIPILTFISGTVIRTNDGSIRLSPGTRLKENDFLRVPATDICDAAIPLNEKLLLSSGTVNRSHAGFRFFPESSFAVAGLNSSSKKIIIELLNKSMYVNKYTDLGMNRELRIRIRDYDFTFMGTRVFFSVDDTRITVACFEGKVKALLYKSSPERELFILYAGEKFEIILQKGEPQYTMKRLSDADFRIDQLLLHFPPYNPEDFSGILSGYTPRVENNKPVEEQDVPVIQPVKKPRVEPFTIKKAGVLDDPALATDTPHFIAAVNLNDYVFFQTEKKVYVLTDNILRPLDVPEKTGFCMKPLFYNDYCFLITSWNLFLSDARKVYPEPVISITKNEKLYFHYTPVIAGNHIYIPATNTGYYKADLSEPEPRLEKIFNEGFPVSPIPTDGGLYIGSYLEHFIAFIDTKGNILWKYDLPGELISNMTQSGQYIFVLYSKDTIQYIVKINKNGYKEGQWQINDLCYSDVTVYDGKVYGITIMGDLFELQTQTNTLTNIDKIMTTPLKRKMWRGLAPYIDGSLLYIGTDTGGLLCYNMKNGKREYKITIDEKDSFYAAPCMRGNEIFLAANSGTIYSVVKNE